jgi:hypothetical protein
MRTERNDDTRDLRRDHREDDDAAKREGDVLGISDADPAVELPYKGRPDSRRPQGIEVGGPVTGIGDLTPGGRGGATGADLGGQEGVDITPTPPDIEETPDRLKDKKDSII